MREVQKGRYAEGLAASYFRMHGYSVLAKNYIAYRQGEIDLVLNRGKELIFVEVKSSYVSKKNEAIHPLERIGALKLYRLQQAARHFLKHFQITQFYIAFLAISIHLNSRKQPSHIQVCPIEILG